MIRLKNVWFCMCLVALSGCSMKDTSHVGSEHLPVVARSVEINGQPVTVGNMDLLEDTIDLPLSYWVDDFRLVKLDGRDEALVGMSPVYLSENYMLVDKSDHIPCKLFRKDGTYVGDVGSIGQGPGAYKHVSDVQIDESGGYIYLMSWEARSIWVYDLQGTYIKSIPLNKKYDNLYVPEGIFKVDATKNRVSVIMIPFKGLPVVAWVQDLEGNFVREFNPIHLKQEPDFSNEVHGSVDGGVHLYTYYEKKDSLYHWNEEKGVLEPRFTMDFTPVKSLRHVHRSYYEFPCHYVGTISHSVPLALGLFQGSRQRLYMVDKETKQGTFFRMKNDFLDNTEPYYLPGTISKGYFTMNLDPHHLLKRLTKALQNPELTEKKRKHLEKLLSLVDENSNIYVLYGRLRSNFKDGKKPDAWLIYDETQLKK